MGQLLGSAYALGADGQQLTETYEHDVKSLVNIDETFVRGDKISEQNWRQFLMDKKCDLHVYPLVDFAPAYRP